MKAIPSQFSRLAACHFFLLLLAATFTASAATTAAVKQTQDAMNKARTSLKPAQQNFDKAQTAVQHAETTLEKANDTLQKRKKTVTDEQTAKLGLMAALARRDTANAELSRARDKIINELKTRPDYSAASQKAKEASTLLGNLSEEKFATDKERNEARSTLSAAIRRPYDLERDELMGNATFQEVVRNAQKAEQTVISVQQQIAKSIESDPSLAKARTAIKDAQDALVTDRKKEEQAQKQLNSAQTALDRATEQHAQAVAQEQRNNKKNR